jgi:predicted secreted protein
MVLDTLITVIAIVLLVASGIVALPWTSGELRGSAQAYRMLVSVGRSVGWGLLRAGEASLHTAARHLVQSGSQVPVEVSVGRAAAAGVRARSL